MKDLTGAEISVGDFLLYATKTESPSLQYGYVEKIVDKRKTSDRDGELYGDIVIYIAQCDYTGKPVTKTVFDYNPELGIGEYRDTGKQVKSSLKNYGTQSDRLLITKPVD